jgi:hypothetical protein
VEWDSEELIACGEVNLFLELHVVKCSIFKRPCLRKSCFLQWDGHAECIFRLSNTTCVGYEVGWMFVDDVKTGGQSFSGFVLSMNNR